MSSGTSTEPQPLQPWQLFTLAGLIGATGVVFMATPQGPVAIILLSVVIFTAAAVGVAAWRTAAPLASSDEILAPQVLGGRTKAALEREKTLVLRAIKDLEFDHAMGKVSDRDFAEMEARLRSRATRLLAQLDAGATYQSAIEAEIARRVGPGETTASPVPLSVPSRAPEPSVAATRICGACQTTNDADARFCKGCGAQVSPA
jgi:hypothetical protein